LYYRGVVKGVLKDIPGRGDFSGALALHPYHFFSRYRRAESYFKTAMWPCPRGTARIALRIEPKNPLALHFSLKSREKLALEDFNPIRGPGLLPWCGQGVPHQGEAIRCGFVRAVPLLPFLTRL
jgi:hypothetical protein